MARIMNWNEYSEEEIKERLMKVYALSEDGAEGMMKAAQDNPGKIIKGGTYQEQ